MLVAQPQATNSLDLFDWIAMLKESMQQCHAKMLTLEAKFSVMDIALKKVELIEWLARLQDEKLIQQIEILRRGSIKNLYEQRMPKTKEELQAKLNQSEKDLEEGKVHSQEEVENYFKAKFKQ